MEAYPEGSKSQLCLHETERGNIWMTARKVLPVCQMLPTSGHLKRDLPGCSAVKRQTVNPRHPVNREVAQILMYKLPRLLKDPKGIWVSITLIFKDPNQVDRKVRV